MEKQATTTRPEAPPFCPVPDQADSFGISTNIELHTLCLWISMHKTYQDRVCAGTNGPYTQGGSVSGKDRWERNATSAGGRMRKILLVAVVLVAALMAQAHARKVTVRGKIGVGSLDSGIETPISGCCGFLTDSDVAASIFSVCKFQDECEITGKIDSNDFFVSVSNVRRVDTNVEPSAAAIKDAACKAFGFNEWSCNDIYSESSVDIVHMSIEREGKEFVWVVKVKLRYRKIPSHAPVLYVCKDIRLVHRHDGWYSQQ